MIYQPKGCSEIRIASEKGTGWFYQIKSKWLQAQTDSNRSVFIARCEIYFGRKKEGKVAETVSVKFGQSVQLIRRGNSARSYRLVSFQICFSAYCKTRYQ